jgi:hypothetical protein
VLAVVAATTIGAVLWRGLRQGPYWLWSASQGGLIRARALDDQSLAIQTDGPRVRVLDLHTGKERSASSEGAILADSPAGQAPVLLSLDATKSLHAIEALSGRPARIPVEPPCPGMNAVWFASGGSIVGLGLSQIARVTADGRCRVSQLRSPTLNFWWAGIDSTGLVYVASTGGEVLYTLRPEDGELQAQSGVAAANEVLAVPTLPGAVVADRTSIALFIGTREVWRTRELRWAGPRAMARSADFVGVRFDQAGARGIGILRASDGSLLERIPSKTGGTFAFARRCLLRQDVGQSDWVTFHVLGAAGTAVEGKLAHAHLSLGEGNLGRVAEDIAFVEDIALVQSGDRIDAYRIPDACR